MDKRKKLIIAIAIIVVLLIILSIIFLINRSRNYNYEYTPETPNYPDVVVEDMVHRVDIRNDYYLVDTIITLFNSRCDDLYSEYNEAEDIEVASKYLYNILDKNYIEKYSITEANVYDKFKETNTYNFIINDMYCIQKDENYFVYFVYGSVGNITAIDRQRVRYIVITDKANDTFSIIPSTNLVDEMGYGNVKIDDKFSLEEFSTIEKKENYNIYTYRIISDEQHARNIFNDFKNRTMYDRDGLYNMLDSTYKLANFNNVESFKNYCINNTKLFVSMTFSNYNKEKVENGTKYICLDQDSNYYTFIETAPMKYTVIIGK